MKKSERDYSIIFGKNTLKEIDKYAAFLNQGGKSGTYLTKKLEGLSQKNLDKWQLLSALMNTKKPQIFAESHVVGDGTDWTLRELSILGDVSIGMNVSIFDNGAHQNPVVHDSPFTGHLIYTPGALLRNDRGHTPADWQAVTTKNEYDRDKYFALCERRLLPVFCYISELAIKKGHPAFVSIPGIGCGQFAGPFRGQMGHLLQASLVNILKLHGNKLQGIKAVYYDPYNECGDENQIISGIQFIVRPLTPNNLDKSQLCKPSFLGRGSIGDFEDCELYSLVAWDHVSWPGNDYYLGARVTDDGVKAAATDTMKVMTGVEGHYCRDIYKYLAPKPFKNWSDTVTTGNLEIKTKANTYVF